MPVCVFFKQGYCRFGSNCRNSHVLTNNGSGGSTASGGFNAGTRNGGSSNQRTPRLPRGVSQAMVDTDLSTDRPIYPLSVYHPIGAESSPDARANNVITGTDVSPDELRWEFVRESRFMTPGRIDQYKGEVTRLLKGMDEQCAKLSSRYKKSAFFPVPSSSSSFAQPAATTFGQPMAHSKEFSAIHTSNYFQAFGAVSAPNLFGAPTFGSSGAQQQAPQPALGSTNQFGSASTFGATSSFTAFPNAMPSFGQVPSTSAFGQPVVTPGIQPNPVQGSTSFNGGGFQQPQHIPPSTPMTTTSFGISQSISAVAPNHSAATAQSSMSVLTDESTSNLSTVDLAFQSASFKIGHIPVVEPPPQYR